MNENFIHDFVEILSEKLANVSKDPQKGDFERGEEFAYFDVLDILKSQLLAFGYDPKKVGIGEISIGGE